MSADTAPYTAGAGDAGIEMLREVFGNAITHIVGGNGGAAQNAAANMLGTAFGFFNGGVLFFGAILLTWVTVFGVTNTANDGEVLGKKWSTFYTPLRTFTASGMLIPSTSGYSVVQLAILLIVTWSVGFASNMWGKVVDYVVVTSVADQALRSVIDDRTFAQTAVNALRMKVCADAVTRGVNQTMGAGTVNLQLRQRKQTIAAGNTTTYITYIEFIDPNFYGSENICGTLALTTTFKKPDSNSSATMGVAATLQQQINDLQGGIGNVRYNAILALFQAQAIGGIANTIMEVADNPNGTISAAAVQVALDQLRTALLKDIRAEVQSKVAGLDSQIAAKFKQGGWVMAGSLHRELARINDAIRLAMTADAAFSPGTGSVSGLLIPGDVTTAVQNIMARYDAVISALAKKLGQASSSQDARSLPKMDTGFTLSDFADGGTSIKSSIQHWVSSLPNRFVAGFASYLAEDGTDPVMQVKNIGDYMAGFGEVIYLAQVTLKATLGSLLEGIRVGSTQSVAGTNISGAMGPVAAVIAWIVNFLHEVFSPLAPPGFGMFTLMYAGYFLGIWLPMIPFFIFGLGVIGWLVQVIEALAAGSLWMVMHLTPENNDSFIGSQQQGYLLLMSLFARPPLMILGLVASMDILTPAVRFINAGFITGFNVIQADSVTGLLSVAGFIVVYCTIMVGVFMLIFSLPQSLPDRILRWIGAGISDMGEQGTASRIESAASGHARTAATSAAHTRGALVSQKGNEARQSEQAAMAKEQLTATTDLASAIKGLGNGGSGSSRGNEPEGHT